MKLQKGFPSEEKFGLISQLRRAAYSIPSNIAEGAGRNSKKDFSNFLSISTGSANEIYTFLVIVSKLGYINANDFASLNSDLEEIKKMLYVLNRKLKS